MSRTFSPQKVSNLGVGGSFFSFDNFPGFRLFLSCRSEPQRFELFDNHRSVEVLAFENSTIWLVDPKTEKIAEVLSHHYILSVPEASQGAVYALQNRVLTKFAPTEMSNWETGFNEWQDIDYLLDSNRPSALALARELMANRCPTSTYLLDYEDLKAW